MSSTTELDELHTLIGGLRRCVDSLRSRYGDNPATRRIAMDAERIIGDVELAEEARGCRLGAVFDAIPQRRPTRS